MKRLWYIGVDLHKPQFTICVQDVSGKETSKVFYFKEDGMKQFKEFLTAAKNDGIKVYIAVETTGNSEYFYNETKDLVTETIMLNTLKTKQLIKSHKKTDKNDARAIATLLRKDIFTDEYRVHAPSQTAKDMRRLLKARGKLKGALVSMKNQIHGILLSEGEETKKRFLTSKKGRNTLRAGNYKSQSVLTRLIDIIETLLEQVAEIETQINELALKRRDDFERIKTIPGCGDVVASSILAAVDDVSRFRNAEAFSAYFGLVPFVNNSSEEVRHGRITKTGPGYARVALVQGILAMVRADREGTNPLVREYYRRKEAKGSGKAIIACAHKLAKIIYAMLKNETDFNPFYGYKKVA